MQHKPITGSWQNSTVNGVMMIRPIFGDVDLAKLTDNQNNILDIYPNPAKDYLFVKTDDNKKLNYTISGLSGQIFLQGEIDKFNNSININKLQQGFYIITLKNSNTIQTFKFFKQ